MARSVDVQLIDDVDGGVADETIRFGLDGDWYEIDLSLENAARLTAELKEWVAFARPVKAVPQRRRSAGRATDVKKVRAWAAANGYDLPARGRIPNHIKAAFAASGQ